MRRTISSLFLSVMTLMTTMGQTAPQHSTLFIEEFDFQPSTASVAMSVLTVVSDSKQLSLPDKSMLPQMNEAVVSGAINLPWIDKAEEASADYTLRGHFTQLEVTSGENQNVTVRARSYIIDNKTGQQVATKVVHGSSLVGFNYENNATRKTGAAKALAFSMKRFILEALPVTGHILQKGVEQLNGKVKEKQCYVDLGSLHGLEPEMMLYVTEGGKYKAELRVVEVMGDDICVCKVVKGDSYITKGLKKGTDMVVTSRPKKIDTLL